MQVAPRLFTGIVFLAPTITSFLQSAIPLESLSFHANDRMRTVGNSKNDNARMQAHSGKKIVHDYLLPLKERQPIPISQTESSLYMPTDLMDLEQKQNQKWQIENNKQETKYNGSQEPDHNHEQKLEPFAHRAALADGIIIKPSEGRGLGAFASLPIPDGAWFGEYQGEIMTKEEVDARYWNSDEDGELELSDKLWAESRKRRNQTITGEYLFDVGDDWYIDGEDIDKSTWCRYINHASVEVEEEELSSRCNAESRDVAETWIGEKYIPPRMFFVALRDIAVGEEICFDYGDYYWDGYEDMIH